MHLTKTKIEQRIKDRVATALIFMRDEQLSDGSFLSLSAADITLRDGTVHKTTFATSLILSCLENVQADLHAKKIIRGGLRFLLHEKSSAWSWNYWPRAHSHKIPDDMDDTFAALIAIAAYKPELIDDAAMTLVRGHLRQTKHLLSGLHNTWIIDYRENPPWDNVDPVINSSIGYFLMRRGINTSEIENGLENKASSQYYSLPAVIGYFISRFSPDLAKKAAPAGILSTKNNALETALILTTLIRLETPKNKLTAYVERLLDLPWSAYGMYTESIKNKIASYAGSQALTAAFCIEALSAYILYE